jgi:hypothetical protein
MTYRDDHDAALARAESLEKQLAESERDRERLRHELEAAKRSEPPASPPAPLVALPREDIDRLVRLLEDGIQRDEQSSILLVSGLALVVLGGLFLLGGIAPVGITIACAGVLLWFLYLLNLFDAPEGALAIIQSVRDEPERIVSVTTRSGGQLVLGTATSSLSVEVSARAEVLDLLTRQCPRARFVEEP